MSSRNRRRVAIAEDIATWRDDFAGEMTYWITARNAALLFTYARCNAARKVVKTQLMVHDLDTKWHTVHGNRGGQAVDYRRLIKYVQCFLTLVIYTFRDVVILWLNGPASIHRRTICEDSCTRDIRIFFHSIYCGIHIFCGLLLLLMCYYFRN